MASFNKVILIGNMVADPELKQTQQGTSVCSFSIAINRRTSRNADPAQQTVDFINIVTWRQTAEFVSKYFKKGKPILICGQLQTRTWTDQQGNKRYATEVVADEVSFVENKGASEGNANGGSGYSPDAYGAPGYKNASAPAFEEVGGDGDDLPF